jgi:hypothetical protein
MPSLRRTRKKLQKQVIRWTIWLGITLIFVIGMFSGFSWVERQVRGLNLPRDYRSGQWRGNSAPAV